MRYLRIELDPGAWAPVPETDGLRIKLRAPDDIVVPAHGGVLIDTGVHVRGVPDGVMGLLSSIPVMDQTYDVYCTPGGTVDDWEASVKVKLYNMGNQNYYVCCGNAIAYLQLVEAMQIRIDRDILYTDGIPWSGE